MKILLVAINAKYIHSNLAIYDLQAYARKYGEFTEEELEIAYREFTINHQVDDILQELYQERADVICFSCYIWNISYVEMLLPELKCLLPDADLWLGGPEVTYDASQRLHRYPQLTGVLCGEGEKIFTDMCNSYFRLGTTYSSGEKVEQQKILAAEEPVDMSEIPFPYGVYAEAETTGSHERTACSQVLVPNVLLEELRNRIIYYESSRGCPFSCSYCLSSVDKRLRFRDVELVKEELQFFIEQGVKQVKFVDRTFNCKKSHALAIWRYLLEHDRGLTNFHFEIGADLLDDEELELLAQMRPGLVQLEVGVQSTNLSTIGEISRKMDLNKLKYAVDRIRSVGNINLHLDLIAGLPYEDFASFRNSFNEVYRLYPDQLQLGFLKVLKGSRMELQKEEYGIAHKSYAPYEVLFTKWLSYDEVLTLKMVEDMVENYYNSGQFTYVLRYLENDFEDPFALFYELGKYYEVNYDKTRKHARIERYHILRSFLKARNGQDNPILDELLLFDLYLRENMKTRPVFAPETHRYKQLFRQVSAVCKLQNQEHLECISGETWKILCSCNAGIRQKKPVFLDTFSEEVLEEWKELHREGKELLYFAYEERNPLNHNATVYQVIEEC